MFGYMGFGMQSWIYKRNPRKLFAKRDRMPSFTSLPKNDKTFELKHREVEQKKRYGLLTILVVILLVFVTGIYCFQFKTYATEQSQLVNKQIVFENREAFDYLYSSGYNRLIRNNFTGAYSEFILAYSIDSNNEGLNKLIVETLSILCEKKLDYCSELDDFVENL